MVLHRERVFSERCLCRGVVGEEDVCFYFLNGEEGVFFRIRDSSCCDVGNVRFFVSSRKCINF